MDLSSQAELTQNGEGSAERAVSELNHELRLNCVSDEKVLENNKNLGIQESIEALNDCGSHEQLVAAQEDGSMKSSQQGDHKKGQARIRKDIFTGGARVLRSRSQDKSKALESVNASAQDAVNKEEKRRKKQIEKITNNEFSKIRTHLRYLLNRMNYEQSFIDAYVGEGWKGQSQEKIKPKKELERATSNILLYKSKTRDLFQCIDTSRAEGRLPESLFDSEGLIDSEDIFCAKCGQKDVPLDNDIILCDGGCERGFHQFCLEPPLLKEQVPAGDEGWLCPACDCKVDCITLLNNTQGTNLSINDTWEKVFPEAAASGNKRDDTLGLPSDVSEDDDYTPDDSEVDKEESSAEDDDYDPDRVGLDEHAKSENSSTDFSENEEGLAEAEALSVSDHVENNEKTLKNGTEDDGFTPITAKQRVERLDYKKLHDEMYENVSSDSSDEDFNDTDAPRRRKRTKVTEDMDFNQNQIQSESTPKRRTGKKLNKGSSALGSNEISFTKSAYERLGEATTQRLYESFKENQYPNRDVRENLAKELKVTAIKIRRWFENARWSFNHTKSPGLDPSV